MPNRDQALQAQAANLHIFVQDNAAAYAAFPFFPWTRTTHKLGVATRTTLSTLPGCAGLRGVVLQKAVQTGDKELPLVYYPGLLMTEAMFTQFSAQYYCPTGLELPALAYVDEQTQQRHKVIIVGDPTAPGAIINDGVRSGKQGQLNSLPDASQRWNCACADALLSV